MHVISARNVHQALPLGLRFLQQNGVERGSRNGPVLLSPWPVTTVYERPCERVMLWPERDANPFFHLYESLWMIAGRNDVAGVVKYAKNMASFSDDGEAFHGAYGWRWREHFGEYNAIHRETETMDQLEHIINTLRQNIDDRRCVLQMWDPSVDLSRSGKDVPCNLTATFQINVDGRLDLTVFCRSNDIVWGAYGANAVHFSFLLEYVALAINYPVGVYRQVSVNWHGYLATLEAVKELPQTAIDKMGYIWDPYTSEEVHSIPMGPTLKSVDEAIALILQRADSGRLRNNVRPDPVTYNWAYNVYLVLAAHEAFRDKKDDLSHFAEAGKLLAAADQKCDWVKAAQEWLVRRLAKAATKLRVHDAMTAGFDSPIV